MSVHPTTHHQAHWRLHKLLLRRIGATALLVAAGLAGLVYAWEHQRLGTVALELAAQRGAQFASQAADVLAAPGGAGAAEVQARLDQFVQGRRAPREGRIIAATIRAADGQVLARFLARGQPQGEAAAAFLNTQTALAKTEVESGRAVEIEGLRHFLLQTPLRTAESASLGSLTAVFAPSDAYLAELRQRLWRTVVLSMAIVLVTSAILYPVILRLMRRVTALSEELLDANLEMLSVVGSAIAKRDADTDAHNYRVTIYSVRLAEAAGVDAKGMQALIKGAFLHDVGKIGIPDHILLKPGKLDEAEFSEMRKHVAHGLDIVGRATWLADAADVVGAHHEKFDGGGYGSQRHGEGIPLVARIFAIADVFDALTSHRPYKDPLSFEATMALLEKSRGTHFDPHLLDLFAGIARPLYDGFANRDDEHPRRTLRDMVVRYFKQDMETLLA